MTTLTPQQIAQYAYAAGFRGNALTQAVAIALAESGGNPAAYNPETAAGTKSGSGSRGLWQIYGAAHPEYNNAAVFDPLKNAQAAYAVYRAAGNSFTPWSTYNNGSARIAAAKLSTGAAIAPAVQSGATGGAASGRVVYASNLGTASANIGAATKTATPAINPLIQFPTFQQFTGLSNADIQTGFLAAGLFLLALLLIGAGLILLTVQFYNANEDNIKAGVKLAAML